MRHFPKGTRYSALEKNILKLRAFEMVLVIFYAECLRSFVVDSIRATDRLRALSKSVPHRLPDGVKNLYKKAWQVLVNDGILTTKESAEIEALIGYRNVIAHATQELVADVNRRWTLYSLPSTIRYEAKAVERIRSLAVKIEAGMRARYVMSISLREAMFEPAEVAYTEEIRRLQKKIRRQMIGMKEEIDEVNANIASLPTALLEKLEPSHPAHMTRSGTLSTQGIACCYSLFRPGATPLAVAYLMRISLRSAMSRHARWQ